MKLASYYSGRLKVGAVVDSEVWDLRRAYELYLIEEEGDPRAEELARNAVPSDMGLFIQMHHGNLGHVRHAVDRLTRDKGRLDWCRAQGLVENMSNVKLLPPVLRPSKIVNIGNAYRDHIAHIAKVRGVPESEIEIPPDVKVSFLKTSSALTAPGDPVRYPKGSSKWDYEGEFAIIIGQSCSHVSEDNAYDYILGYTVSNDASNRDVPVVLGGLTSPKGKSADTLAPLGPWIVTHDSLYKDPNNLSIKVWVNDEIRQDANTSLLLWPIQRIVAVTSSFMHLYPGDVIATGSPAGTGLESGRYLKEGDVVRIEIEGIGVLENPVGPPW